LDGMSGCHSI